MQTHSVPRRQGGFADSVAPPSKILFAASGSEIEDLLVGWSAKLVAASETWFLKVFFLYFKNFENRPQTFEPTHKEEKIGAKVLKSIFSPKKFFKTAEIIFFRDRKELRTPGGSSPSWQFSTFELANFFCRNTARVITNIWEVFSCLEFHQNYQASTVFHGDNFKISRNILAVTTQVTSGKSWR